MKKPCDKRQTDLLQPVHDHIFDMGHMVQLAYEIDQGIVDFLCGKGRF